MRQRTPCQIVLNSINLKLPFFTRIGYLKQMPYACQELLEMTIRVLKIWADPVEGVPIHEAVDQAVREQNAMPIRERKLPNWYGEVLWEIVGLFQFVHSSDFALAFTDEERAIVLAAIAELETCV